MRDFTIEDLRLPCEHGELLARRYGSQFKAAVSALIDAALGDSE